MSRTINTSLQGREAIREVQERRRSNASGTHRTRKFSPKGGRYGIKVDLRNGREG